VIRKITIIITAIIFLLIPPSSLISIHNVKPIVQTSATSSSVYETLCSLDICSNKGVLPRSTDSVLTKLNNNSGNFPDTLGISQTGSFELGGSEQRFTFFTQGRWWVFYNDFASPNHNVVYTSSRTGNIWAPNKIIQTGINGGADYFGVGLSGSYFYYASNNHSGTYDYIQWLRGIPDSNGAIKWGKSYNISLAVAPYNPSLTADSSNYPFISYNSADNNSYPYVIKSTLNNGTWNTASGYPVKMDSGAMVSNTRRIVIVPLTRNKMAAVWEGNNTVLKVRSYDGNSTWNTVVRSNSEAYFGEEFSVTSLGDVVNIAYTSRHSIHYDQYQYWGNSLNSEQSVVSTNYDVVPNLVQDGNVVYLFWGNVTTPEFYYMYKSGSNWTAPQRLFVDYGRTYSTKQAWLFTSPTINEKNQICLVYATGIRAPFHIRIAIFNLKSQFS
jgi:hypothetical protein